MESTLKFLIAYLILSGFLKSSATMLFYFSNWSAKAGERFIQYLVNLGGTFELFIVLTATVASVTKIFPRQISFGDLLNIDFAIIFNTDPTSLTYILVSFIVIALVGRFSCFYLHKDSHYYKFFALFYIFQSAMVLLILSDSFVSYFVGWELLGISSVLLISFYSERKGPVHNSLRVFTLYKISDILLFGGFAVAFSQSHFQLFSQFPQAGIEPFSVYMLLTSLAIMIKMGGFPVIWLPRAMEGPTPSTAVFYGALATHIPLLLFINLWSGAVVLNWVRYGLMGLLLLIILMATVLVRISTDAKNMLANATVKHIAIISIEALLGLFTLAYVHLIIHCFYRLFQFIRTPSLIYEYHEAEGLNGGSFSETGTHYNRFLPLSFRKSLYRLALNEFYLMPKLSRIIDVLMGLTNRISRKKIIQISFFNGGLLFILALLQLYDIEQLHPTLFLLIPPWIFALIALLYNFRDWRNISVVLLSVTSLSSIIFYVDEFISLLALTLMQLTLFSLLVAIFNFKAPSFLLTHSFTKKQKVLLFIFSLWLVGVPGPGTYYLFEKSIHLSIEKDLYLAIGAFIILSINTLSVVKNYSLDEVHFRRNNV